MCNALYFYLQLITFITQMSTNDMVVQGVGKNAPKKGAPVKQEPVQLEPDKVLEAVKQVALNKVRYTTIDIKSLNSVLLKENDMFNGLKMALETFNEEIRQALLQKRDLDNYPFKKNLFSGLRNLLMEVVETENKELRNKLLERASNWFSEKLAKKEPPDSQRPTTAMTHTGRGSARPWTSQTQGSLITPFNMSNIQGGGNDSYRDSPTKSFLETDRKLLPSELRAEILRDYEAGARSKHDYTNPPYERYLYHFPHNL
jgi:hypothetical protein